MLVVRNHITVQVNLNNTQQKNQNSFMNIFLLFCACETRLRKKKYYVGQGVVGLCRVG